MSSAATAFAWKQREISSTEKLILLFLADKGDDEERVAINLERICEGTGLSESTARTALKTLTSENYLAFDTDVMRSVNGVNRVVPQYRFNLMR